MAEILVNHYLWDGLITDANELARYKSKEELEDLMWEMEMAECEYDDYNY